MVRKILKFLISINTTIMRPQRVPVHVVPEDVRANAISHEAISCVSGEKSQSIRKEQWKNLAHRWHE